MIIVISLTEKIYLQTLEDLGSGILIQEAKFSGDWFIHFYPLFTKQKRNRFGGHDK